LTYKHSNAKFYKRADKLKYVQVVFVLFYCNEGRGFMGKKIFYKQLPLFEDFADEEIEEDFLDELESRTSPRYEDAERIIRLLTALSLRNYTRGDVFERIPGYNNGCGRDDDNALERARKKLERDLRFLARMGYTIGKAGRGVDAIYSLARGSQSNFNFFFDQSEVIVLSWLSTLFMAPTTMVQCTALEVVPQRHPFAEDILALVSRFVATLPPDQKRYFERLVQRPAIYFNLNAVVDYTPFRAAIDKITQAIWLGRRIRFHYSAGYRPQGAVPHDEVDPHYIMYLDGHFYLLGYSYERSNFFELRLDRMDTQSIKLRSESINRSRTRPVITFRYWAEEKLARSDLSQRWLSHEIERRDVYFQDERGKRRGVIVKATAPSRWRIIQQLHKYAETVKLLDPPYLCEQMEAEVERMHMMYKLGYILS
jgi:predicted DNA-binding transcriptional regulator YafY